jgi:pre-60S factor REI1
MASITASRTPGFGVAKPEPATTHPYTCNTCQVAFRNSELQRGHMRSDWHRYNLKRRVTSLPPISSEVFTEKVLQAQASTTAAASRAAYEKTCTVCARTYFSENAYQNHLGSTKHKAKLAMAGDKSVDDGTSSVMSSTFSLGEPMPTQESIDSDAEEEFNEVVEGIKKTNLKDVPPLTRRPSRPHHSAAGMDGDEGSVKTSSSVTAADEELSEEAALKRCLFCNYDSPSVPLNASHMERIHGMFIPERNYLVDLEGLIGSLYEKIHEYHECLYCGKLKPSVFGLQTHMRDKGHCKVRFDTEEEQLEIGEFYDFRSTYSDDEEMSDVEDELPGKKRSGGVKLGAKRQAKTTDEGGDEEMEEGDGWETDSSASSLDSADLTAVPLDQREHQYEKLSQHPHHSHSDPRPHRNKDGWHSHAHKHAHAVFYSDYELHLPSGRTAGHRSLNKYYSQNLHNHPSPAERQEQLAIEEARGSDSDSEEVDERVARRNERERGRALTSRANGGLGMIGVSAEKKKEVAAAEKRSRKVEGRERRKYEWGVNKQNNSQKHFRDPLLQ